MNRLLLLISAFFVFFLLNQPHSYSQTIDILPLGNSITQSDDEHLSYRYPLWTKLIDDGLDFNFVGSLTSNYGGTPVFPDYNGQSFDQDHEGHWGWRCDQILNGLPNWLSGYTPDLVMIHLGTNDLYQGSGNATNIAQTIQELEDIITMLRGDNPQVIILLSNLIPSTNAQLINKIPDFNSEIPQIAVDMYDTDSPIILVDQFDGFDASNDTFDGVHPNSTGEEKMAQKWRDAIADAVSSGIRVNLKLFLEGPFNGTDMNNSIPGQIPLQQPFNMAPWNYSGGENFTTIPADAVDWVLVELRDTTSAVLADASTVISRQACLLTSDGKVLDVSESFELVFDVDYTDSLFVVVYHRNHLPVLSSSPLVESVGIYSYDFTDDPSKALGTSDALKELTPGNFGLFAGDFNADGIIDDSDYTSVWKTSAGQTGYLSGDSNLDSQIENRDKNELWLTNKNRVSQIP